jgi:hypothetical protein
MQIWRQNVPQRVCQILNMIFTKFVTKMSYARGKLTIHSFLIREDKNGMLDD